VQLLVQGRKTGRLDLLEYKEENLSTRYILTRDYFARRRKRQQRETALWKALKISEGKFTFHYNLRSATITSMMTDVSSHGRMRMQDEAAMIKPLRKPRRRNARKQAQAVFGLFP